MTQEVDFMTAVRVGYPLHVHWYTAWGLWGSCVHLGRAGPLVPAWTMEPERRGCDSLLVISAERKGWLGREGCSLRWAGVRGAPQANGTKDLLHFCASPSFFCTENVTNTVGTM